MIHVIPDVLLLLYLYSMTKLMLFALTAKGKWRYLQGI